MLSPSCSPAPAEQGVLRRRQHQGICRILRRQPAGISRALCGCSTTWCRQFVASDKPVICRMNGMRIGGGQEIGMAWGVSIAPYSARFGPSRARARLSANRREGHRLPPDHDRRRARRGRVRIVRAVFRARRLSFMGVITNVRHRRSSWTASSSPIRWWRRALSADEYGRLVFGKPKTGDALKAGQELIKRSILISAASTTRSNRCAPQSCFIRKWVPRLYHQDSPEDPKKIDQWNRNKENSRAWLALDVKTERAQTSAPSTKASAKPAARSSFIHTEARALATNAPLSD